MNKLLSILTLLFFVFANVTAPVYAGIAAQSNVVALSEKQIASVEKEKPLKWYEKVANAIVRPFKALSDMDLNIPLFILGIIFPIISSWKIFEKAGIAGWWSLIPIGSFIMFLKMIDRKWTNIFWLFVPIMNIIKFFQWNMDLAEKFGKERVFGFGLSLLYPIFGSLLAWDNNVSYK